MCTKVAWYSHGIFEISLPWVSKSPLHILPSTHRPLKFSFRSYKNTRLIHFLEERILACLIQSSIRQNNRKDAIYPVGIAVREHFLNAVSRWLLGPLGRELRSGCESLCLRSGSVAGWQPGATSLEVHRIPRGVLGQGC